jgi:hypothetical protein
MSVLGGSIFVHNAVKFDYCLREAIESLCYTCDHVVALDAGSQDGTFEIMQECQKKFSNLRVFNHGSWECAPDKHRLSILANQAKDLLPSECDWHFMLQADEVIHENARDVIKRVTSSEKNSKGFWCRRFNLWGDFDHYVGLQSKYRPCGDYPCRLAIRSSKAVGDAESLDLFSSANREFVDQIVIFHYGLVRNPVIICDKIIDMQSWFFGFGGQPDPRVVKNKAEYGMFQPFDTIPQSELCKIPVSHPVFMEEWLKERRPKWPFKV